MNISKYLFLAAALGCATLATSALAEDLYVISHPGIHLLPDDIREVFLGEKQFSGSVKIVPVDNAPVQAAFLNQALKMDLAKYNTSWTKKSFRDGLTPPVTMSNDVQVTNYVKSTPGAVGYVATKPDIAVIQKY